MLNVDIPFCFPGGYSNPFVSLNASTHTAAFRLLDGQHVVSTSPVNLGTVHRYQNRRLIARFEVDAVFDETTRTVTIPGTDFHSRGAMRLITFPEGSDESCRQYGFNGFFADDHEAHPHWNYVSMLTPGLEPMLRALVREMSDRLRQALRAEPGMTVRVREHPPRMSVQEQWDLLVACNSGDVHGRLQSPTGLSDAEQGLLSIDSIWGGTVSFSQGERIANVIGSKHDPKIAGNSWLNLWRTNCNDRREPALCTSYMPDFCDDLFKGGHVVAGPRAKVMPIGSDAVYIMPICTRHNNNDSAPMAALQYRTGVWLKHYMQNA